MIHPVRQAADFVSRYGNVSHADQLLQKRPTEEQLQAAAARCHACVDTAIALLRRHHGMELVSVTEDENP